MTASQSVLNLIGRDRPLFDADITGHAPELSALVAESRFLVIGGVGFIGSYLVGSSWPKINLNRGLAEFIAYRKSKKEPMAEVFYA